MSNRAYLVEGVPLTPSRVLYQATGTTSPGLRICLPGQRKSMCGTATRQEV